MGIEDPNAAIVRYAQVWEDADTLLEGLQIQPGDVCLSIASGGDNALAMLAREPARVIAIDRNPGQLFCLELKVAAFRCLDHESLLELVGSRASVNRTSHYDKCRPLLSDCARRFWDKKRKEIHKHGIGGVGRFERFARIFRQWILPIAQSRGTVENTFVKMTARENEAFFDAHWNRTALKMLVHGFCSRPIISIFGRGVVVFEHVEGRVSNHVIGRIKHGLRTLSPSDNPYLHWILCGRHGDALPFALRRENFEAIKKNLDRLEWHLTSVEDYIDRCGRENVKIDKFNLSNVFDYMSEEKYTASLHRIVECSAPGARMIYWNMMVPRSRPRALETSIRPLGELAARLHAQDKAVFYSNLNIEEVVQASGHARSPRRQVDGSARDEAAAAAPLRHADPASTAME